MSAVSRYAANAASGAAVPPVRLNRISLIEGEAGASAKGGVTRRASARATAATPLA
ncbi:MAG: hypothetical protein ACRENH_10490 [Gemmatimonadaceae bacterium]